MSFVSQTETNGVIERFFRTLKEAGRTARSHRPDRRRGP